MSKCECVSAQSSASALARLLGGSLACVGAELRTPPALGRTGDAMHVQCPMCRPHAWVWQRQCLDLRRACVSYTLYLR